MWSICGVHDQVLSFSPFLTRQEVKAESFSYLSMLLGMERETGVWEDTVHELRRLQKKIQRGQLYHLRQEFGLSNKEEEES